MVGALVWKKMLPLMVWQEPDAGHEVASGIMSSCTYIKIATHISKSQHDSNITHASDSVHPAGVGSDLGSDILFIIKMCSPRRFCFELAPDRICELAPDRICELLYEAKSLVKAFVVA